MVSTDIIDYMSKEEILDLQNNKLSETIPYIIDIPFYKKKLIDKSIDINDIKEIFDLEKFPFTTKEELRPSKPIERIPLSFDGLVLKEVSSCYMKRIGVIPVKLEVISPGSFSRENIKSRRIKDER